MTRLLAFVVLAALAACLSPVDPVVIRLFDPVPPTRPPGDPGARPPRLRLASPTTALHLDEAMTWRLSDVEIVQDERNRWVATPDVLVGSALRDALATRGILPPGADGEAAPSVATHVAAFEVVRRGTELEAVVTVDLELIGTAPVRRLHRSTARETLPSEAAEAVATATREALARAIADAVGWLDESLRAGG